MTARLAAGGKIVLKAPVIPAAARVIRAVGLPDGRMGVRGPVPSGSSPWKTATADGRAGVGRPAHPAGSRYWPGLPGPPHRVGPAYWPGLPGQRAPAAQPLRIVKDVRWATGRLGRRAGLR